jgi:uncharacterized spore protein YtfJ
MEEMIGMTRATRDDRAVVETITGVVADAGAGKVFGTPITHGDVMILPAAKVTGGGGGGSGTGPAEDGSEAGGAGGGLGLSAKPLGAFVIKDGKVRWLPAIDVNKVIIGGQLVAVAALLVVRAFIKARSR